MEVKSINCLNYKTTYGCRTLFDPDGETISISDNDHTIFDPVIESIECICPPIHPDEEIIECDHGMSILVNNFGEYVNPVTNTIEVIKRYTWKTRCNMQFSVVTYGARIVSIQTPDRHNNVAEILMRYDTIKDYIENQKWFVGATIGQCVGKLEGAAYCLNCAVKYLSENDDSSHSNGGAIGFDQINWVPCLVGSKLVLSHVTTDGFEGYPGCVSVTIEFDVKNNNVVEITTSAVASKQTPFDVAHRLYFNLAGHNSGVSRMKEQLVSINANSYLDPTCRKMEHDVAETPLDLRVAKKLGVFMENDFEKTGFDNYFVVNGDEEAVNFAARLVHQQSGRAVELYTTRPILLFNTCNELPEIPIPVLADADNVDESNRSLEVMDRSEKNSELFSDWQFCTEDLDEFSKSDKLSHASGSGDSADIKLEAKTTEYPFYSKHSGVFFQPQNHPPRNTIKNNRFHDKCILRPQNLYSQKDVYVFGINYDPCDDQRISKLV